MRCPVCDVDLSISSREGVEIDFCPQCRGVWLDRGELDKILDRVALTAPAVSPAPAPEPAPRYDDRPPPPRYDDRPRYDDDRRPHYDDDRRPGSRRRKKSFLDDLFDFD